MSELQASYVAAVTKLIDTINRQFGTQYRLVNAAPVDCDDLAPTLEQRQEASNEALKEIERFVSGK